MEERPPRPQSAAVRRLCLTPPFSFCHNCFRRTEGKIHCVSRQARRFLARRLRLFRLKQSNRRRRGSERPFQPERVFLLRKEASANKGQPLEKIRRQAEQRATARENPPAGRMTKSVCAFEETGTVGRHRSKLPDSPRTGSQSAVSRPKQTAAACIAADSPEKTAEYGNAGKSVRSAF